MGRNKQGQEMLTFLFSSVQDDSTSPLKVIFILFSNGSKTDARIPFIYLMDVI